MTYVIISDGELYHHGVKGMHWGVRRYQNADGTMTPAGRKRYTDSGSSSAKSSNGGKKQLTDEERAARNAKIKKAAIAVGVTALVAAGTYAAVKYNNKTMDEAKEFLSIAKREKLNRYVDELTALNDQETFSRKMMERSYTGADKSAWSFANQEARANLRSKLAERSEFKRISEHNIADRSIQRQAQNEVIKRDIASAGHKVKDVVNEKLRRQGPKSTKALDDYENTKQRISRLLSKDYESPLEKQLREMANRQAERMKNQR